jgi:hypothetical protein
LAYIRYSKIYLLIKTVIVKIKYRERN